MVTRPPNGDHVESYRRSKQAFSLQVAQGGLRYFLLLDAVDSIGGMSWFGGGKRFDLDKNERLFSAINRDEIDFTEPIGFTLCDDQEAFSPQ